MTGQRRFDRKTATLLVAALTPGLLNACSTMDMVSGIDGNLIPPASIGSGGGVYGSPTVNTADSGGKASGGYDGMAAPTPPYPVEKVPAGYEPANDVYQQPAPTIASARQNEGPQQQNSDYLQNATFQPNGGYQQSASPTTTIQSAPLLAPPTNPQPAEQPAEAAAEPSYSDADDGYAAQQQDDFAPVSQPAAASQPQQQTQTAALGQSTSEVQFLPLVGAPNEQANLLAQALADEANRSGMTIRPASDGQASVRLKGYFSTFDEGNETVLVYVWDVLDRNDERIHRIQGQERYTKSSGGPWGGVDLAVLDRVARTTLEEARRLPQAAG